MLAVQLCTSPHTHMYMHTHTHTHMYMHTHTHTHTCTCIRTHTHTCTCIRTHTHAYNSHPHTHTYTYIHIHTHTCMKHWHPPPTQADGWTDLQDSLTSKGYTGSQFFTIVFIFLGHFIFTNLFIGVIISVRDMQHSNSTWAPSVRQHTSRRPWNTYIVGPHTCICTVLA